MNLPPIVITKPHAGRQPISRPLPSQAARGGGKRRKGQRNVKPALFQGLNEMTETVQAFPER